MKRSILFLLAGVLIATALPLSVSATETWEKKLIEQGWIKLTTEELKAFTNSTFYFTSENDKSIYYIDWTGKKGKWKNLYQNFAPRFLRAIRDDKQCFQYPDVGILNWNCSSIWKKGNAYKSVHENGWNQTNLSIKKGNPENL